MVRTAVNNWKNQPANFGRNFLQDGIGMKRKYSGELSVVIIGSSKKGKRKEVK